MRIPQKGSTSIPLQCLIYKLCIESGMKMLHHLDSLLEVQRTFDNSLIKVEDNPVALQRAPHQPSQMTKVFMVEPPPKTLSTTTFAAYAKEKPLLAETTMEREPTTITTSTLTGCSRKHPLVWSMCQLYPFRPWQRDWPTLSPS